MNRYNTDMECLWHLSLESEGILMMKRLLGALLLCAMLSCLLTGALAQDGSAAQAAIDARKQSGDIPTVTMAFLSFTGPSKGADRVNKRISEYTQEKLGVAVDIINIDISNYSQQMQLMFTSDPVDIFCAIADMGLSNSVNNGYALDLEENDLLATYGQNAIAAVGMENINTCRIGGTLYGIPQMKEFANGIGGVFIRKEYLDAIGYDYNAVIAEQNSAVMPGETIAVSERLPSRILAMPDAGKLRSYRVNAETSKGGALCSYASKSSISSSHGKPAGTRPRRAAYEAA